MTTFWKKAMSAFVSLTFLVSTMSPAVAATPETVQAKLEQCEDDTYGQPQTGAIMERINKALDLLERTELRRKQEQSR